MKRRRLSARPTALRQLNLHFAASCFSDFHVKPGQKFITASRVSSHPQALDGNCADQEKICVELVTSCGGIVIRSFRHTGRGCEIDWLREVFASAAVNKAIVLAETPPRYIRHPAYHPSANPGIRPSREQYEALKGMANQYGVTLMTVCDSDATPCEIKSQESKRGQIGKGRKGGRRRKIFPGYMKKRRQEKLPNVIELYHLGRSLRQIEADTKVPSSTAARWILKHG